MNSREFRELVAEVRPLVESWLDELRRTMTSADSTGERGAHRISCPNGVAGVGVKATTVANELMGYSFRETAGAAATIVLRDGTDNTGDIVATIALAANASTPPTWFAGRGIGLRNGLFVDRVAGATEGAVYLRGGGAS